MAPSLETVIVLSRYAHTVAADHGIEYSQAILWMRDRASEVSDALHLFCTAEDVRAWANAVLATMFL